MEVRHVGFIRHPLMGGPMEFPGQVGKRHAAVAALGRSLAVAIRKAGDQDWQGVRPPYRQIAERLRRGVNEHNNPVRAGWWLGLAWQMAREAEPVATAIDVLAHELALAESPASWWDLDPLRSAVDDAASFLEVRGGMTGRTSSTSVRFDYCGGAGASSNRQVCAGGRCQVPGPVRHGQQRRQRA